MKHCRKHPELESKMLKYRRGVPMNNARDACAVCENAAALDIIAQEARREGAAMDKLYEAQGLLSLPGEEAMSPTDEEIQEMQNRVSEAQAEHDEARAKYYKASDKLADAMDKLYETMRSGYPND